MTLKALCIYLAGVVRFNATWDGVKIYGRPRLASPVYRRWKMWRDECLDKTFKDK